MQPHKKLPLNDSPYTKVFRQIVATLQEDPILKRTVKTWVTWDGSPLAKNPPTSGHLPRLELIPRPDFSNWVYPDTQGGDLVVIVNGTVSGLNTDDPLNLAFAIASALYPTVDANYFAIQSALRSAGSQTGQVRFSQMPVLPTELGAEGQVSFQMQMRIDVIFTTS